MKEYGWVLTRINREIKIITDMHRVEEGGTDETAGISLIRLFEGLGYTTKCRIFTGSTAFGREKARQVNATANELEIITSTPEDIVNFCSDWVNTEPAEEYVCSLI